MKKIALIILIVSSAVFSGKSQSCSLLCNGDFELPALGHWAWLGDSLVPCWQTNEPDSLIEIWPTGYGGVPSYTGLQFIEIDAKLLCIVSQNVVVAAGSHVTIGFAHRGRYGVDTMAVEMGPVGGPYVTLGIYADGTSSWGYYTINYTLPTTMGNYFSLRFHALYGAGGNPGYGNFLDDVSMSTYPGISSSISSTNTTCDNNSDGTASVTATSGISPYTYQWSSGQTTSSVTGLSGGLYICTVTDSKGCSAIDSVTITQTATLGCIIPASVTLICSGDKTGSATAQAVGGTPPYLYKWAPGGETTASITGLGAGVYTVTVKDSGGCSGTDTVTIFQSPYLNCKIPGKTNISCTGTGLGSATASGSGGVPPYTYMWSPGGETTATISNLSAGTYTVAVTDINGCNGSTTVVITTQPGVLYACCGKTIDIGSADTIKADSSLHYQWSPAASLNCDTCKEVIATPTVTTTYTVIGTDADGCTIERVITVIVETPCNDYTVPNVFTPNGDAVNDLFVIKAEHMDKYSINIYDRWGKEMYKSTDATQSWNGKTENGGDAPTGVYYYLINSTCLGNNYKKEGFVQLIR